MLNESCKIEPQPPNPEGKASCIVRWLVETRSGWLGAWDKEAFADFASTIRKEWYSEWSPVIQHVIDELEAIDDETSQSSAATLKQILLVASSEKMV